MNRSPRPLVALAAAFALGAALPPSPAAPALAGVALVALAIPRAAPAAFAAFGWCARSAAEAAPAWRGSGRDVLEGTVTSVPERFDDRVRFAFRERGGEALLAWTPSPRWPLAPGDQIRFAARLRVPDGARNPGGRDPAAALRARGIALEAHAVSAPVRVAAPSPLAAVEAVRRRFAALAQAALPAREAALVRAIGAGDRDGIGPTENDAFARSGLSHILSVSGLHLTVVAWGAYRVIRAVMARWEALAVRLEPRRAAAAVAIPLTLAYATATGAAVPTLRSAVGAAAAFAAVLLDREHDAPSLLALAALAILAADPGALLDPSFQLSFASVAGLAAGTGPLRRGLPAAAPNPGAGRAARAREWLLVAVCASAAATIATAPIVALHFRRVSLAGLLANVPGVPLGAVLTVTATAAAVASAVAPPVAELLLCTCRPAAWGLLAVNDAFAGARWAAPGIASPGPIGAALATVFAFATLRARGRARAASAVAFALALLLPGPARRLAALHRGGLEVVFVSVGHGDAAVLRLPDGSAVLVDGGGDPQGRVDPGSRDVLPLLRDAGVRTIAATFLSHAHPDHLSGLPAIHAELPFERMFVATRDPPPEAAADLSRLPAPNPFPRGATWERAGVRFESLGPPPGTAHWTENDASLVVRVTYGRTAFLFLGDVEAEGEAALVDDPGRLVADVVKVPHHGSGTSSGDELVAATHARYAVASLARESRYGFPAPQVVARWREAGAEFLRTDEGAVRFVSDGTSVRRTPAAATRDAVAILRERP